MSAALKNSIIRTSIAVALFCFSATAGLPALAEDTNTGKAERKEMHHAMQPQYCPMHRHGRDGREGRWHHHNKLMHALKKLNLTDAQKKSIHQIRMATAKSVIQKKADLKIANMELHEMLRSDKVDMSAVKQQLNRISELKTAIMLDRINGREDIKALLTPEQKKTLSEIMQSPYESKGNAHQEG